MSLWTERFNYQHLTETLLIRAVLCLNLRRKYILQSAQVHFTIGFLCD